MKKWKQILATTLTATLTLALCACGGGSDTSSGGNSGSSDAVNSAASKEGVFDLQEYDIQSLIAGEDYIDYYVSNLQVTNDRLYFLLTTYYYDDTSDSSTNKFYVVSMNTDGTDMQKIEPELWKDGVNPYKPEEETAAVEDAVTDTEGVGDDVDLAQEDYTYTWENEDVSNLTVSEDGSIIGIKAYYYEHSDADGNHTSVNAQCVTCWNEDGTIAWDTEIEGLQTDDSYSYVTGIITDADGTPAILISGDQRGILEISSDGTLGEIRQSDTIAGFIDNYSYIKNNQDGTISVLYYDTEDWATQYVATYDLGSDTLSEPVTVPSSVAYNMQGSFSITSDGTLWYENSSGIYSYTNGDEAGKQVLNFVNSDLYTDYFNSIFVLDDQHIIAFYYETTDEGTATTGGLFTYVAPEDIPDKAIVTIGTNGTYNEMRQRVVEFNKKSDTTRITIKDYSEYNSYEDYEAWKTQLNNDILSGNMPDILQVSDLGNLDSYVSKGLFANVDDLIANDPELADTEFLENVFEALRVDGTLYEVFPYFNVSTLGAKSSLVGDKSSLTMEEALAIVSSMGEDAKLISGVTRDYFFSTAMQYVGREYVDVSTGTCDFDSEGFISLLEYAKTLPTEEEVNGSTDSDGYINDEFYGDESQYRENRTLLDSIYIGSITDINYYLNGYFGEDISYVGFPNNNGCNGVITTSQCYALSAKSEVLDEAWDFISYYIKDEYQSSISYGLPVSRSAFEARAQEALERPYYEDENGNKVEYDETFWINDEEITLPTMTQEQVDKAVAFIESVSTTFYYDEDVINIINEEAEAFYTDQKSAEDVAKIIQSRVQIFVQESM